MPAPLLISFVGGAAGGAQFLGALADLVEEPPALLA
jgi:hypothetical protein